MTSTAETVSWRFGGVLSNLPPVVAWSVLGVAAVGCVVLVAWSYRRTLVTVEQPRLGLLLGLRLALCLGFLAILAAPTRVERVYEKKDARPLAVVVDRSDSMTAPDNRHHRRMDDALLNWRALEPSTHDAYGAVKTFVFAGSVEGVETLDGKSGVPTGETKFFSALQNILSKAPPGGWGGVITLTDGLDTSDVDQQKAVSETATSALAAGTPLFFIPGKNRYSGGPFIAIQELTMPGQTAPRSIFRVEAVIDSYQSTGRTVDVKFSANGIWQEPKSMRLEAGRHEAVWSTEVQADASGTVDFEVEVENEKTRGQVRIAEPTPKRILYFQGALDWSYRFLANILRRDSSFVLTPVFTFPNARAVAPQGVLPKFPNTVAQLQGYDIVVLSNVAGNQLNAAQQNALTAWVRGGGILLFFTPDDDSTQGLSGSELEKILPVVFAPPQSRAQEDTSTRELLQQLARLRQYRAGSVNGDELAPDATPPPKLNPFAWEEHSRAQEIFSEAQKAGQALGTPLFTAYAHVASAKPGAEVLARHPVDTTPGKSEHAILLAMQRYGRGQTAVLTSDALWRWKLNQPSEQRGVELFWQNLFGWLARERQSGLQFEHMRLHTEVGADYDMRISGAADSAVTLEAVQRERHVAIGGGRDDATARVFRWKPPSEGQWEIHATDDQGREARHWVSVETTSKRGELSGLPPNEGLMRELAGRTGGALIEANSLPPWQAARDNGGDLITERHDALWDRPWVFGILLLLYASELILRRTSKLL